MGCTSTLSGCVLVLVNIVFFLIGLALAAGGGILQWAPHLYTNNIENVLDKAANKITTINSVEIKAVLDQIFEFLNPVAIVVFVIGLVFAFISLLAICGVCCKSKCIIGTYAVIIGIIAAGVIAFTVILFVQPKWIENFGETTLKKFVLDKYEGTNNLTQIGNKGISGILDLIQLTFKCCGVTNYTDFYGGKWNQTYVIPGSNPITLTIPLSCCMVTLPNINNTVLQECVTNPSESNSHINNPCYGNLWKYINKYWRYIQYGFVGFSVLLVLLIIAAICATRFEDDDKVNPL